ncbi:hypothetical protein ACI2JA_03735 [Alkalihalobacillus sp. NPDC078783]
MGSCNINQMINETTAIKEEVLDYKTFIEGLAEIQTKTRAIQSAENTLDQCELILEMLELNKDEEDPVPDWVINIFEELKDVRIVLKKLMANVKINSKFI